ncbi:hypothetical protein RI054_16g76690 [Pseudoscourfieldia marina]
MNTVTPRPKHQDSGLKSRILQIYACFLLLILYLSCECSGSSNKSLSRTHVTYGQYQTKKLRSMLREQRTWVRECRLRARTGTCVQHLPDVGLINEEWDVMPWLESLESLQSQIGILNGKHIHIAGCSTGRQLFNHLGDSLSKMLALPFDSVSHPGEGATEVEKGKRASVPGSDGFAPKERQCYREKETCNKHGLPREHCSFGLCKCRMKQGAWISRLRNASFTLVISFSWKEHMLDNPETWYKTDWSVWKVQHPNVFVLNAGIHAFHGLDPAWYSGGKADISARVVTKYYDDMSKLLELINKVEQQKFSCFFWKTMNDFGSWGENVMRTRPIKSKPDKIFYSTQQSKFYRRLGEVTFDILKGKINIIDTRILSRHNPSQDPFHHPNLQESFALIALSAILKSCVGQAEPY